jgi:hypothetical protein
MILSRFLGLRGPAYFLLCALAFFGGAVGNEYAHKGVVVAYLVPPVTTGSSAGDVVERFGMCDPSSYIKEARILLSGQDPRKDVYIKVWAPGFPVVEAAVLKLGERHFVRNMFILTALVWSIATGLCCLALRDISGSSLLPLLMLLVLGTRLFYDYLLDEGVVYSESLAIAIFMPSMIWFCAGWARNSLPQVLAASLGLLVVGFLRSQFLLVVEACFAGIAAYTVLLALWRRYRPQLAKVSLAAALLPPLILAACIGIYAHWNDGEFVHNEYFYRLPWRVQVPPDMFDTGGMGVLCQADAKTCERMRAINDADDARMKTLSDPIPLQHENWEKNKQAVIHTLVTRPFRIVWIKLHYFARYLVSDPLSVPSPLDGFHYVYGENILFAAMGVASLAGCAILRRHRFYQALGIFLVAGWAGSCIVNFTVLHFEVRYLFFGKALDCFVFALVMAHVCRLATREEIGRENRVFKETP